MIPLKRILHVDDQDDIRHITRLVLQSLGGFEVESCPSGRAALEKVKDFMPDLIVLDVMIPDMDGPATLAAPRRLPNGANIPVIFMTAKVQPQEQKRLMKLGAVGIITKPYEPQTLPQRLHALWAERNNVS